MAGELIDSHQAQRESEKQAEEAAITVLRAAPRPPQRRRPSARNTRPVQTATRASPAEARRTSAQWWRACRRQTIQCGCGQRRRSAALPRHHVTVERRGDGARFAQVFNRMLVVDPPYGSVVDPAEHDERTDGIEENVTGSSTATVIAGPIPGSTPTAMPTVTPASAHRGEEV